VGLFRAKNLRKDQSYALWGIEYEKLKCTLFPLGDMTKSQVRKKARELGLRVAEKAESQEICFIPDDDYGRFLSDTGPKIGAGEIVDDTGKVIGRHKGYIHYTIGQRKGLGGGFPQPLFVKKIEPETNRIFVSTLEGLISHKIKVGRVNWLIETLMHQQFEAQVKVRYRDPGRPALVKPIGEDQMEIDFPDGVIAPTPGQSAVVYIGERVIAGGVIEG
jgi:tRNA-specific 2-thiouridylase